MNKEEGQNYVPSKYSKAFNSYSRKQMRNVFPILHSVARSCHVGYKYPIYKVLKAVAKIFLLNEIEAIFLAYMIGETNWDIRNSLIVNNSVHVRDVVCLLSDQPQYKCLILYLILVTYSLKFYLNESSQDLLEEATRICPNFKDIFQSWVKKHSHLTKRINPKTLNHVYVHLYAHIKHQQPDYSLLVDSILQISPAYNPEKLDKDRRLQRNNDRRESQPIKEQQLDRTTTDRGPYKLHKRSQPILIEPIRHNLMIDNHTLFSSSRINEMTGMCTPQQVEISNSFQVFDPHLKKSCGLVHNKFGGSAFCSSVIGMPNLDVKDEEEEDCEQLNIGLQEGQSEQNIVLEQEATEGLQQASITLLSRANSLTEKYLSLKSERGGQ